MALRAHSFLLAIALTTTLAGCVGAPAPAPRAPQRHASTGLSYAPQARACLTDLGRTQAGFTPLPDQYYGAGCSTLNTVKLNWLRSDTTQLQLSNLGPVTCPLANTLSGWARFGVDRAARSILGSGLRRIETMGSYNCRTIAGSDRLSAHATANAIDVSAFVLENGRRVTVAQDWAGDDLQARAFLRTIRDSACKRFGTVLTPQFNAAHHDHLHLEV
ncbi:extensin family protein, partial [Novosphingobium sp.]|uniref:extensin family protein n=2 Tax=unclassified Novosphingobium TaxID=2644732 RepID=UPI0038B84313